jgi:hypothetical protein
VLKSFALRRSLLAAAAAVALVLLFVQRGRVASDVTAELPPSAPEGKQTDLAPQVHDARQEASTRAERSAAPEAAPSVEDVREIWRIRVRSHDATGAVFEAREGSVTFDLVGPDGARPLTGRVVDGLWTARAPYARGLLRSSKFWSARVAEKRFVHSGRQATGKRLFDGTEELVIEEARPSHLHVVDPRTGELARSARLVFSSISERRGSGEFRFELTFNGQPLRLDDLRIRELENQNVIDLTASIPGVGEESTRLLLDGGTIWHRPGGSTTYELRPSGFGSVRFVWRMPDGYRLCKPRVSIRPDRELSIRLHVATSRSRTIEMGEREKSRSDEPGESPVTEVAENVLIGDYVAEFWAARDYKGSHPSSIGSARFSVDQGNVTEVEFRPSPAEADPWRLLRIALVLPPGFEGQAVDGSLKLLSERFAIAALPRTEGRDAFLPVLVSAGRHDLRLRAPLEFATSFDVGDCPEHVERIVVPSPVEYSIRFRHAVSGEWVNVDELMWRPRLPTEDQVEFKTVGRSHFAADAPTVVKTCMPIEVLLPRSSRYTTPEFTAAQLAPGDDGVVLVQARPRVVVRFSCEDRIGPDEIPPPALRPLGGGRESNGAIREGFAHAERGVFVANLGGEGGFELQFQPMDGYATPTNRTGHARLDEETVIEVELVKTH